MTSHEAHEAGESHQGPVGSIKVFGLSSVGNCRATMELNRIVMYPVVTVWGMG